MTPTETLAALLKITAEELEKIDAVAGERTGRKDTIQEIVEANQQAISAARNVLGLDHEPPAATSRSLQKGVLEHEKELLTFMGEHVAGADTFARAVTMAREVSKIDGGFFLKKSYGQDILRKRPPQHLLEFFKYATVDELLEKHDITEIFSALRFMESTEWMHETFDAAYSSFTAADFEERPIEIKVLGPEWKEVAAQFVAKKHHNVSHLKEFGVIFLNPIAEDAPGKFLRDFALLFHYSHEIDFYSKLFRGYAVLPDFADHLKSLLRGDIKEVSSVAPGEWLVVQRYLYKENPADPRLFLPHLNPESLHWARAEQDLAAFGAKHNLGIRMWGGLDWVGELEPASGEIVSYDMEDTLMSAVAVSTEGSREKPLNYHQHEALWTKLFMEYAGGEEAMEQFLMKHFTEGVLQLS